MRTSCKKSTAQHEVIEALLRASTYEASLYTLLGRSQFPLNWPLRGIVGGVVVEGLPRRVIIMPCRRGLLPHSAVRGHPNQVPSLHQQHWRVSCQCVRFHRGKRPAVEGVAVLSGETIVLMLEDAAGHGRADCAMIEPGASSASDWLRPATLLRAPLEAVGL